MVILAEQIRYFVESIGILASATMFVSMSFKTTTFKGTIFMRVFNFAADLFFFIYGILLPAYAMIIANFALMVLNAFYLIKEIVDHKKKMTTGENKDENKEEK